MPALPLLSGPPPIVESKQADAGVCRKCAKGFRFLVARSRRCNHCGYWYCYRCTGHQALMPRTGGYDITNVCDNCIEFLTITAGGRDILESLSVGTLQRYIRAYSIDTGQAVGKDGLADAILATKGSNGCLSAAHEDYYRQHSVPDISSKLSFVPELRTRIEIPPLLIRAMSDPWENIPPRQYGYTRSEASLATSRRRPLERFLEPHDRPLELHAASRSLRTPYLPTYRKFTRRQFPSIAARPGSSAFRLATTESCSTRAATDVKSFDHHLGGHPASAFNVAESYR
ncbi:hypothetical protein FB451DRAFT_376960 [Mycena latifolia]|nr:hypothetical protein FB451DRAFT_376960 [Mycena latifolia]